VNGEVRGAWLFEDCEERRRFMRPVKRFLYSKEQRVSYKKVSKRLRQKYGLPDPDITYTSYDFYWTSFRALKRNLIKNNTTIELVKEEE
jgi:hypothetical protein